MEQEIKGFYDLSESCLDVWGELNPYSDNKPTAEELDKIRGIILAHYAWTAKRLGQGHRVSFIDCATWQLKLRQAREVTNFQTRERFQIPDFWEVEVNASPVMEDLIREQLTPPVPNVK